MRMLVIHGKQGSGKTELAKKIIELNETSNTFERIIFENFADPIKILMRYSLNKMAEFRGVPYPPENEKDGDYCQVVGTWAKRKYGKDVWVDALKRLLSEKYQGVRPNTLIIIGDCRQENEFEAFPDALRVSLNCPEDERRVRCEHFRENTNHESEVGLDAYAAAGKFDLYYNTSSVDGKSAEEIAKEVMIALFTDYKSNRKDYNNGN